ncbi:glycosyltransferase family 2 protein [Sphingomonas sp. PAMC 26621]|uniref:glycosyltransferase family 2 protein n=1 Tax=Sphingomonas sp. PAMC 26621 TaxID=1112213 RepID=UPI000288A403|nr:glycosyl transferase [Sphingomonas sp. PAMC 26621]
MPFSTSLSIAVIIASTGRPRELAQWKQQLLAQTCQPDAVYLIVASQDDLPAPDALPDDARVLISPKGLTVQRNYGIDWTIDQFDIIAFFDDDYIASCRAIENIRALFQDNADLIAASGHLILDGIGGRGHDYATALAAVSAYDAATPPPIWIRAHDSGVYGCNMAYRSSAIGDLRFDERLPLYGWLEDVDFGSRLLGRGMVAFTNAFAGVHQGVKSGRTSGVRLGYSQIANPIYLYRKGTLRLRTALRCMTNNVGMNVLRALYPEPWVDRAGRLRGNVKAFLDLIRGTLDPGRILDI